MLKIFKNKVGRPSNETIRKRRIIISSLIAVVIIFVGLIVINKDKIFNLKGAVSKAKISINYDCDTVYGGNTDNGSYCKVNYKLSNTKDVKSVKIRKGYAKLTNGKISGESSVNVRISERLFQVIAYYTDGSSSSKEVWLKQNGFTGQTYFYDQSDYPNVAYCGRELYWGSETIHQECQKGNSICSSGCGGTSIAMALSNLTQSSFYDPKTVSERAGGLDKGVNNYCQNVDGTSALGMKKIIQNYGFNVRRLTNNYEINKEYSDAPGEERSEEKSTNYIKSEIKKALKNGAQVVINAKRGCFTSYAHFMLLTGMKNNDEVYLYDPNGGDESIHPVYGTDKGCYNLSGLRNGPKNINKLLSAGGISASGEFTVYIITNPQAGKNVTLNCPTTAKVNQKISCTTNLPNVKIRVSHEGNLSDKYTPVFVTTASDKSKSMVFTKAGVVTVSANLENGKLIKKQIKVGNATTTKKNTTKTTTTSKKAGKVTTTSKLKNFTLSCPKSINVNTKFECKADESGVRIGIGGVNGLASGYKSVFTTGLFDKSMSIKYTDKLFTNYKSLIKVDGNGKQYINAKVTAKKSGYKTITTHVRVYNGKTVNKTNTAKKTLSFTCPSAAKVGEKIVCVTDQAGVTIRTSNPEALASGYTEKFVTTTGDYTKSLSYTKAGTYYVKATKSGYKEVKKTIKITASASNNANSLVLTCPSSVYVNEPILCTTNMVGVTIRGSNPESLAAGTSDRFVTTASDLSKSLKYKKAGTYYVKASKSGYGEVKKAITVKNRVTQTTVNQWALKGLDFLASMSWDKKMKTIKITPTYYGSKVKYDTFVMCETYNDCVNSNAWTNMDEKYNDINENPTTYKDAAKVNKTKSVWIKTSYDGVANKAYYLRVTTYLSNSSSNWGNVSVYKLWVDGNNKLQIVREYSKFK